MGVRDIIYAVGITPQKLDRVARIRAAGCNLSIFLDSVEQAHAVAEASQRLGQAIPALIELDCDGHRSGVSPGDPVLVEIGEFQHAPEEIQLTAIGDVLSGRVRGRETAQEITVFDSSGLSVQDLFVAQAILALVEM